MTNITNNNKYSTVINKNTYYFFNEKFEEAYEAYINSLKEILLSLKNRISNEGLRKELFEELIHQKKYGLKAILVLSGLSNESLKRLLTFTRIIDDRELNNLIFKNKWASEIENKQEDIIREWNDRQIESYIKSNKYFRKGLVNIFFEGSTVPILSKILPLFELKKLSISKLGFNIDSLVDTLIRYKEKGSYSGMKGNNPEVVIENILKKKNLNFERGDLEDLISNTPYSKRRIDFIIPNKTSPKIFIECTYLVTTSSGQGDKSKTEISIDSLLKKYYPDSHFIGFIDGIGWYVRKGDLKRMVSAYEDVFTFHQEELIRFEKYLEEI